MECTAPTTTPILLPFLRNLLEKNYSIPNTTQTVAKGITPKLCQPGPVATKKNKRKGASSTKAKWSQKRVADSDEDNESSESDSDKVKKRLTKKRRIQREEPEEASEVEMVEDVELPEPKTEEVDDNVN